MKFYIITFKLKSKDTLEYIIERTDLKNSKFIIFGQFIGGAVAIYLGAKNQNRILWTYFRKYIFYSTAFLLIFSY